VVSFLVEQFIHQNGYLTVFISVALAGEVGLFAGVALARSGAVSLTGVVVLGTVASFVGNTIYYYAGKFLWKKWSFLRDKLGEKVDRASRVVNRFGSPIMLVARFFYGIRDIVPITLGLYQTEPVRFAAYNLVGAFLWAYSFTVLGKAFSSFVVGYAGSLGATLGWVVISTVIVGVYLSIRRLASRLR
jgi:membrane protein DedA with SNARE-associated domain